MDDFYSWLLGEKAQVIISGVLGGLVRWLTLRERPSAGAVSVIVGAICAVYLGPLVQPILSPFVQVLLTEQVSRASFTGFLCGIGGITITGFLIDMFRAKRREVARDEDEDRKREIQSAARNRDATLGPDVLHHLGSVLRQSYLNLPAVEPESPPSRRPTEPPEDGA